MGVSQFSQIFPSDEHLGTGNGSQLAGVQTGKAHPIFLFKYLHGNESLIPIGRKVFVQVSNEGGKKIKVYG